MGRDMGRDRGSDWRRDGDVTGRWGRDRNVAKDVTGDVMAGSLRVGGDVARPAWA